MERRASIRSPTLLESAGGLVGAGRFERPTPCAQGRCATRLRYAPTFEASLILNHFQFFRYCQAAQIGPKSLRPWQNRDKTPSIDLLRVKTRPAFNRLPVDLLQRLPFHLQLHLRVLLEDLRVALPQQLRDPLIRHATRAEASRVRRPQIVDPEIRRLCPAQGRVPYGLQRLLMARRILVAR